MAQPPLAPITAAGSGFDPQGEVFNRLLQNRIVFLGSDVNDTIANLITAQRAYEMNSKVISATDEMLSTLARLR